MAQQPTVYLPSVQRVGPIIPPQPATASRRQPGLPIPPQPVMPPEGIGAVTDPTADAGGDAQSPTTMVLNYLKQRGFQPSSENVRRALEANARDPGVIPGLRSDRPATDAEDQAAMRSGGGGGGGSPKTSAFPQPVDLNWQTVQPFPSKGSSADPTNTLTTTADQAMRFGLPTPATPTAPASAGPPAVPEVPRSPIDIALDRATNPAGPELPAPPIRPGIAGPPEVPAIAGPQAQAALPPPPEVPMLPAPPRQITGPPMPGEAAVAQPDTTIPLPNQSPQGQQGGRVRVGNVTPKIAPGNPIQGAPIEPGPVMGPLGRSVVGGLAGARRGIPGIVAGAAPGAVDLGAYIAKNLHLR